MTERLVMHPDDYASLRAKMMDDISQALGIPGTLMGIPVSTSDIVPQGQVLCVKPQPLTPIAFQGIDFGSQPDRTVWFRYGFDLMPHRGLSIVSTLCEGGPWKRPTKAQRRRRAQRFIREEVARRRMLKAQGGPR